MSRTVIFAVILAGVAGCSAQVDDVSGAQQSLQQRGCDVDVEPAAGAVGVSVLSRVALTTRHALRSSSVSEDTVRLFEGESRRRIEASVGYDRRARTVTLTPASPLSYGTTYRVEVSGWRTRFGPLSPLSTTFTTARNERLVYADVRSPSYGCATLDDEGRTVEERWAQDPGDDGEWCTADDAAWSMTRSVYLAGRLYREYFVSRGGDGVVGTEDDYIPSFTEHWYGPEGERAVIVSSAAYEQVYDDLFEEWFDVPYPASLQAEIPAELTTGPYDYRFLDYDDQDRLVRQRRYQHGRGADDLFNTQDDVITGLQTWEYRDDGSHFLTVFSESDPGPDGAYGTDDDVPLQGYERDAAHATIVYNPGPDGLLQTADDLLVSYTDTFADLATGLVIRAESRSPAGELGVYTLYTYDDVGNRVRTETYSGGELIRYETFDVAH